jgi:hypothetical protein
VAAVRRAHDGGLSEGAGVTRGSRLLGPARWLSSVAREDRTVLWLAVGWALFQLAGALWDLPSSHGWENDAVAPRDLFGGVAINLTPGRGHRYPLLHYLLLALLSVPVLLVGVLSAAEMTGEAIRASVLSLGVMTGISVVAKLVTIGMGVVCLLVIARMTRRLFDSTDAGRFAAAGLALCLSFAFYGRTSNLDVPYLMWTVLSLERLLTLYERGEWRDYALFAGFAAAAVATKDQAYGAFVLVGVVFMVGLPALRLPGAGRLHWKRFGGAIVVGALALGVLGGGLLNPSGFLVRLDMLTGTNSQDWRVYERGFAGVLANLADVWRHQERALWPWPVVLLAWLGVGLSGLGLSGLCRHRLRLLPLVAGLSTLVFFVLVAARSEERFMLPLGVFLAPYFGLACAELLRWSAGRRRLVMVGLCALLLWPAARNGALLLTQWGDARRQVESWLAELPEGTTVETFGLLVYQPRFVDGPYRAFRIGPKPGNKRNPLINATEVQASYAGYRERGADVLVLPEAFAQRYLVSEAGDGRVNRDLAEAEGATFFPAAFRNELPGYQRAFMADATLPGWARALGAEPIRIHSTSGVRVLVLVRDGSGLDGDT